MTNAAGMKFIENGHYLITVLFNVLNRFYFTLRYRRFGLKQLFYNISFIENQHLIVRLLRLMPLCNQLMNSQRNSQRPMCMKFIHTALILSFILATSLFLQHFKEAVFLTLSQNFFLASLRWPKCPLWLLVGLYRIN